MVAQLKEQTRNLVTTQIFMIFRCPSSGGNVVRLTPRGLSHLWLWQYRSPLFRFRVGERTRSWTDPLIPL